MASRLGSKQLIRDLVTRAGNTRCADCGATEPDWASCSPGVFVCLDCSGSHRNLLTGSRVKSILLDYWDEELVEFMKTKGNDTAKELYEKAVPVFYYRPKHQDCVVLRDQWIKAKYERLEFTGKNVHLQETYSGSYEGMLWKKSKKSSQFLQRKFVLSRKDFTLLCYRQDQRKGPKEVISLQSLNAVFHPHKIGHPHGLQISYTSQQRAHNLFVYHDSGQEIVNFFNNIRSARFSYLKTAFPAVSDTELLPWVTRNYVKEGFMEKTGPMQREVFRKRWFVLDSQDRKLLYFKNQLDGEELGAVFIGHEDQGYAVVESESRGARGNKWKFGVTVDTPERRFVFMCERERDQQEWLEALRHVINTPMLPHHYTTEAAMRRK